MESSYLTQTSVDKPKVSTCKQTKANFAFWWTWKELRLIWALVRRIEWGQCLQFMIESLLIADFTKKWVFLDIRIVQNRCATPSNSKKFQILRFFPLFYQILFYKLTFRFTFFGQNCLYVFRPKCQYLHSMPPCISSTHTQIILQLIKLLLEILDRCAFENTKPILFPIVMVVQWMELH